MSGVIETTAATPIQITIAAQGSTNICYGDSVLLYTNPIPGYSYEWRRYGVVIQGANNSSYYAKQAGVYKLKATSPGGCISNSNIMSVNISCKRSDINALPNEIVIYPNPATDQFTIQISEKMEQSAVAYELYNSVGNLIDSNNIKGTNQLSVSTSKISAGIYTVRVIFENGSSEEEILTLYK
jgi:hypothetical protein